MLAASINTAIPEAQPFKSLASPANITTTEIDNSDAEKEETLPFTLPAAAYTSEQFLRVCRDKIFNKNWHFITIVNSFDANMKHNDREAVQFNFIGNPFFGLCDVEDVYNVEDIHLYYGVYDEIMKGVETPEQKQEKLSTLKQVNHVVTPQGLIFISHEEKPKQAMWDYYGNKLQPILEGNDFRKKKLRRRLTYECDYGFITFIDGYQECLHCQYTHPAFNKVYPLEFYKVETYENFCRQFGKTSVADQEEGLFLYFFPTCTLNCYGGGMGIFRCNPVDANTCRMEFEYYFDEDGSEEEFLKYYNFARQVAIEDIELCVETQKNLKNGIYHRGILNPNKENGVIYYQNLIKEKVLAKD